jgi:hypothetical protein
MEIELTKKSKRGGKAKPQVTIDYADVKESFEYLNSKLGIDISKGRWSDTIRASLAILRAENEVLINKGMNPRCQNGNFMLDDEA